MNLGLRHVRRAVTVTVNVLVVDARLYSCLANGSAEEFQKGENLYRSKTVKDPVQIGTYLI